MRFNAHYCALLAVAICLGGCSQREVALPPGRKMLVTSSPSMPIPAAGHAGGVVDGLPVVAGGSTWSEDKSTKRWLHEVFILRNGVWIRGPDLPQPLADPAYAHDETGLYVAGGVSGKTPVNTTWVLKSAGTKAKWMPLPNLPVAVDGASGAILSGQFYVLGGFTATDASNRFFALNLGNTVEGWRELAPLPAPGRAFAALAVVGDSLYHFGGFNSPPYQKELVVFADAHRYDPANNTWARLKDFDFPGYGWTAAAVGRHQVLLVGRCPKVGETTDDIFLLDLRTMKVETTGKLPGQGCCMPVISVSTNTWLIPGGEPDSNRSRTAATSTVRVDSQRD